MIEMSKKKISIIVPVYNVENYVERCLNSLVKQTIDDIEIIVINDGSTDGSQTIIDKFVQKYPEKIKSYIIENAGAAQARNIGLDKAVGEYVGFVDSDDYVATNMFEQLYDKAIEDNADIVNCAYYRKNENRCIEKETTINDNFGKNLLEEPDIMIDSVPYIWNKIFKRTLIEENNIRFQRLRIYEDLVFTYELFINANKISKIFEPLYFYTVTRATSLTHDFSEKRFDIFEAFRILIDYAKEKKCYDELEQAILFTLLKHIYVVLGQDVSRKTVKLKKQYINKVFEYLNTNFNNWNDNIYFEKFKKNKKKYTSKLYWTFKIVFTKRMTRKIKRISNVPRKMNSFLRVNKFLGSKFVKYTKKPIDEKAILLNSQQGDNINGNIFYILKELQNKEYNQYEFYVVYKREKENEFLKKLNYYHFRYKLVPINTKKYVKVLATAKYLFNDTSFPTYFIKREGQIYLNTWHGTPLKTLGKATNNDFFDIANVQKNFAISDYLLYPSEYMKKHMLEDYMLSNIAKGKVMLCGYPRNEIFLNNTRRMEVRNKLKIKNNKQIIAYMPTWRGSVRNVLFEEQLEQIRKYLLDIDKALKKNQVLYVNFHPYIGNKIDFLEFKNIFPFPNEYETYDFLNICDILITDYSSVFFDYALTKNKIILFTYDEKEYLRERGMYLKLSDLPFPKVDNTIDLIKEINSSKQYNDKEFLKEYCNYESIDMSKKICNNIILNKKNDLIFKDIVHNNKDNVLIYAGSLNKDEKMDKLITATKNIETKKYNYFISYITRNIRNNKRQLRDLKNNKVNYMGQLGNMNMMSRSETILLSLVGRIKSLYNLFNKKIDKIYKIELKRIYDDISFKGVILYGKIGVRKIYEFSNMPIKKILYLTEPRDFNQKVNKKIYERFDLILSNDDETLKLVKKYCQNAKIKKVKEIEDSNFFDIYV